MLEAMKSEMAFGQASRHLQHYFLLVEPLGKFVILLPLFLDSAFLEALIPKGGNIATEVQFQLVAETTFWPY